MERNTTEKNNMETKEKEDYGQNNFLLIKISFLKGSLPYQSEILNETLLKHIRSYLSPTLQIKNNWRLIFSIKENGRSFRNMIEKVQINTHPSILFIEEPNGNVIGVFFSYGLGHKLKKIGTDETRLFRFNKTKDFFWYKTTALNDIFCFSCPEFLAFGCSDGKYGLVINKNLVSGESNTVKTFNNAILSDKQTFQINKLEIWHLE